MTIDSRFFNNESDLARLVEFLGAANRDASSYWHPGDLIWALYQKTTFDPRKSIRLWEGEDGELFGFTIHEASNLVMAFVHPRLRGQGVVEGPMFAWATAHTRALLEQKGDPEPSIWTKALNGDAARREFLGQLGMARDDYHYLHMSRELIDPPPAPALPAGFTVRHVADESEYEARVDLHREVWHPSKVTLAAYRGLRAAPIYRPDLDLVAVAEAGTLAAYCIAWFDPISRTGEFEPVGTRPAFQGRGLGKAVIFEGLRRLRDLGATSAIVYSVGDNEASRRLYESVGFQVIDQEHLYGKDL
ncbi:MAG: GNAT family N-acetyltransferase [Herpetosiphonaceae bacterium]|nr:GNAT family N-acetyltransferase [Herpetosiphonaceae bacterium]